MRTMNKVANSRTRTSNIISPSTANSGSPKMRTSSFSDLLGAKEGDTGARAAIQNAVKYVLLSSDPLDEEDSGSEILQRVAKQLQLYKPPKLIDEVEENIEHGINEEPSCVKLRERRAAVLICLFEGPEGELRVILTRRSMNLASHPGDVALPGGKMEEGDEDESATALRETMEEIGLDSSLVQVVAKLEFFLSQHLLTVVPVIGLVSRIEDFKPLLNTDEVDAIFDVPLDMFLKKENHRFGEREWRGWKYVVHHFDFESEQGEFLIWGLTASILIRAASVIYQQSPFFQAHLPDFQSLQKALHGVHSNAA